MRRTAILFVSILAALPAFCQTAPAAGAMGASGPAGPHPKSNEENNALVAMFKATDPNEQIKDSQAFLTAYPASDYKAQALLVEATGYNSLRQYPKATALGEESLSADPKNYETLLFLADIYARTSKITDLNLADEVSRIDKCANDALAMLNTMQKPKPDLSDADWASAKANLESQAYTSLGFGAILANKLDDAKADFQKFLDLSPDPLEMLYIERAYAGAKHYDEAMTWADKAVASPNASPQIKQIAASDKTHDEALKKAAK